MVNKALAIAGAVSLAAGVALAQSQAELIDVYAVKIKQEKRLEFESAVRKFAEANRRNSGDHWIAYSAVYGAPQGTVVFASLRQNMGEIDSAFEMTDKALTKAIGAANLPKFFSDFSNTVASEQSEIRMRRPDLSVNLPDTADERARLVGESRLLRFMTVRAKPGMVPAVLDIWAKIRSAMEKEGVKHTIAVSQALTGEGGVFYFTSYAKTYGEFDTQAFDLAKALGDEEYRNLQKDIAAAVADSRTDIYRMSPELSNAPENILAAAPEYWKPKPLMAVKPKPAAVAAKVD